MRKFNCFRLSSGRSEDYSIALFNLIVEATDGNLNTMNLFSKYFDERPNSKVKPGSNFDMRKKQFLIVTWGQGRRR